MFTDEIISGIRKANSIAILPHISVDGDGLGSSLALGSALLKMGKRTAVYLEEKVPLIYSFLPGIQLVNIYNGLEAPISHDLVIALDTGDLGRLGKRVEIFNRVETTINIDHHATNSHFASFNLVNTGSSAVGEMVYQLLKALNIEVDTAMAACLYVAIATDTGGFRYGNTTPDTHRIAADLISCGIDVADISQRVFDTVSFEKVRLMGAAIGSLELLENGKVAFITITEQMFRDTGAMEEDCDGIVNIGRNIRGVEVASMFRQWSNGEVRVNLRSNTDRADVAAVAALYSGGGHKKAAGCTIKGEIEEVKSKVLNDLKKVIS